MASGFDNLLLPKRAPSRKRAVRDLMPVSTTITSYLAVFTCAYLAADDDASISSFDALFARVSLHRSEESLRDIRSKALLYEGDKVFPTGLGAVLCPRADSCVFVRSVTTMKISAYPASEVFEGQEFFQTVDEDFGEFEMTDEAGSWYCFVKDDDPVVFLGVTRGLAWQLSQELSRNVMQISGDFIVSG